MLAAEGLADEFEAVLKLKLRRNQCLVVELLGGLATESFPSARKRFPYRKVNPQLACNLKQESMCKVTAVD